ncbi:hypothetical protein L484_008533 [Morus notabilis]|uniref:Uncharacterized protein n=1 Tax=Morus notabilis TaxID=981085 RepID=W9RBA5_9ROSA|nr:hypothetical protein L484_008533 [Morus notabilis]
MDYVSVVSATRGTTTSRHESPPHRQDHKTGGDQFQARAEINPIATVHVAERNLWGPPGIFFNFSDSRRLNQCEL